ncbi:MAG: cation:dicarboxylate symporter family transporter, partial [Senegalia sp. (in: firmicutes)]
MNGIFLTIVNILVFLALTFGLFMMQKKYVSFTKRVLLALFGGIVFGAILQLIYGPDSEVVIQSNTWISIVGTAYVRLLKMIVIPLVFVAITGAIIKQSGKDLGKMAGIIILVLVLTTGIAALVGVGTASIFDLSAEGLEVGENESQAADNLENRLGEFTAKPIPEQIVEIIPTNPFYAMTGQGSSATLSVVLFAAFISVATLGLKRKKPESAEHFVQIISTLQDVVMRMVTLILRLTPYGVLALMTGVVSTSNFSEI